MKYHIHLTEEDYLNYNIYTFTHSAVGKRSKKISVLLMVFLSALLSAVLFNICYKALEFSMLISVIAAILFFIYSIVYSFFSYKRKLPKRLRKAIDVTKKDGSLPFSENSDIELTEDEFIERTDKKTIQLQYKDLERIEITETYIFLYLDSQSACIIPYSALGDDKDKVAAFLKSKIK